MAMLVACEPCRQRKRKCDRAVPTCSLCKKRDRQCFYPPHRLARDQEVATAGQVPQWELDQSWALHAPDLPASFPITARWYMPRLIKHFCEGLGVSHLPVDRNSTAWHIQTHWLQGALSDPCLFHATLYAGSSHFDLQRGQGPSSITLFHQSEAIRLLNERLSDPNSAADDRTIVAVTPLAMFADLNGDQNAANIHKQGLWRLVQMRGGMDQLGFDGLPGVLIKMNTVVYNIVFDLSRSSDQPGPPPMDLERRILLRPPKESAAVENLPLILNIFHDIYNFKLDWHSSEEGSPEQQTDHLQPYSSAVPSPPGLNDPVFHCCHLAATIFHTIVSEPRSPSSCTKIDALASDLEASLALTETELWLRRIPAVFSWVCLTGAAAASNARSRIWFYFRQASAVRILNVRNEPSYLDELWAHFYWLRRVRLAAGGYVQLQDAV
ncbi:hypothetical protein BJY04DRAFT_212294 [Aspergillus karnatakaensis]|uniref:Zn(II)2Cys6 transcription factor n=1 Tax=Aspergillus karnatakaensis TaxID=1810916 RepID=UPI003CCDC821